MMEGRRYSDGLHQALEAKEGVTVQNENQTLASITFQNYFRMFPKLAGMTGTAMTESAEFMDIYKLQVVSIPPNRIVTRKDEDDEIYRTAAEKYEAIIKQVDECHKSKQPVLVGTVSIEKSELLSKLLKKKKLPHHVLNAKHHEKEAHIIAQAGRPGAITIATNMAGRGTDIILGGNLEMLIEDAGDKADQRALEKQLEADKQTVIDAGGLFVLATERHESRRIDNQLRGRAGRQGDPGVSKFYLSLEDDLMRIFGSERIGVMLQRLGLEEGEAITHPWISRAIRKAQNKVESHNFDARKTLLKFDDVMNDQRKVIYDQRVELMESEEVTQTVKDMRDQVAENLVNDAIPPKSYHEEWDLEGLDKEIFRVYGLHLPVEDWAKEEGVGEEEILQKLDHSVDELFEKKEEKYGQKIMQLVEKKILLLTLDQLWKDHLLSLDHLRQGIGLRAYGQKDPLNEYKSEAFVLFEHMLEQISDVVTTRLAHMELRQDQDQDAIEKAAKAKKSKTVESRAPVVGQEIEAVPVRTHIAPEDRDPADVSTWGKVGRNEPCPCGSGKKFKHCHGKLS
jgi:preprotein translocase subunit SecA